MYADNFRHRKMKGSARHCNRHVQTAGADGKHAQAASGRRVGVGTQKRFAGSAEFFQMHLMAYAVSRTGKPQTVFCGNALQIAVIVHVFKIGLQRIVVDVGNGQFGFYPRNADGFKLQIRHRAGRILRKRLIDFYCNMRAARYRLIGGKIDVRSRIAHNMLPYDFFG